jgi:DNA-directed RNA polymerase specialized sigma24 family protein
MSALAEWPRLPQYPAHKPPTKLPCFDADIKRFAHYAAHTATPYIIDSEDLAQEARLHLVKVDLAGRSDVYVRSAIFNATREARRSELRFLARHEPEREAGAEARRREPAFAPVDVALLDLQRFLSGLPIRLRQLYDAIYVRNCDQRTVAVELGISQPRIAKLHGEILKRGREYFGLVAN